MATSPLVLRVLAASVNVAKRSGTIIRKVLSSGDLGIVEKVIYKYKLLNNNNWIYELMGFTIMIVLSPGTRLKSQTKAITKKTTDSRVWTQVILYSGEPLSSHHVEMAYLNTCAKRYSILFKWSSALIFSNRVPNCRHESLDVFRILLTLRPYAVTVADPDFCRQGCKIATLVAIERCVATTHCIVVSLNTKAIQNIWHHQRKYFIHYV